MNPESPAVQAAFQLCCDMLAKHATRMSDLLVQWDTDRNGLIDKKEVRRSAATRPKARSHA